MIFARARYALLLAIVLIGCSSSKVKAPKEQAFECYQGFFVYHDLAKTVAIIVFPTARGGSVDYQSQVMVEMLASGKMGPRNLYDTLYKVGWSQTSKSWSRVPMQSVNLTRYESQDCLVGLGVDDGASVVEIIRTKTIDKGGQRVEEVHTLDNYGTSESSYYLQLQEDQGEVWVQYRGGTI